MKMIKTLGFFGAAFARISEDNCLVPPVIENFNVEQFSGVWWNLAGYPEKYLPNESDGSDGKCIELFYDFDAEKSRVNVNNTSINPVNGQWAKSWTTGYAYQEFERSAPNLLFVDFVDEWNPEEAPFYPNYWVLDTDYDEYAAGMNCYRLNATHTNTQHWILGRDPAFVETKKFESILLKAEEEWKMDLQDFVFRYNYDCTFDFVLEI